MIVVVQCAARKRPDAGMLRTKAGAPVLFVADPTKAPNSPGYTYVRPDDLDEDGVPWRQRLLAYNRDDANELSLKQAADLYSNSAYRALVDKVGLDRTFILSAGWGLIRSDFLTPRYDITFSAAAAPYARRRKTDRYGDFCMLPSEPRERIAFFGGRDYVPLFVSLTAGTRTERVVIHNSSMKEIVGCSLHRFETSTRTNWHYEAVRAYIREELQLPEA